MNKLKITFERPKNGWLPFEMKFGSEQLLLDVSVIPEDPIKLLIEALLNISEGRSKTIIWLLEPIECELAFKVKDDITKLEVTLIEYGSRTLEQTIEIKTKEILLAFWRALRVFESYDASIEHWPSISETSMASLTSVVTKIKNENKA